MKMDETNNENYILEHWLQGTKHASKGSSRMVVWLSMPSSTKRPWPPKGDGCRVSWGAKWPPLAWVKNGMVCDGTGSCQDVFFCWRNHTLLVRDKYFCVGFALFFVCFFLGGGGRRGCAQWDLKWHIFECGASNHCSSSTSICCYQAPWQPWRLGESTQTTSSKEENHLHHHQSIFRGENNYLMQEACTTKLMQYNIYMHI